MNSIPISTRPAEMNRIVLSGSGTNERPSPGKNINEILTIPKITQITIVCLKEPRFVVKGVMTRIGQNPNKVDRKRYSSNAPTFLYHFNVNVVDRLCFFGFSFWIQQSWEFKPGRIILPYHCPKVCRGNFRSAGCLVTLALHPISSLNNSLYSSPFNFNSSRSRAMVTRYICMLSLSGVNGILDILLCSLKYIC